MWTFDSRCLRRWALLGALLHALTLTASATTYSLASQTMPAMTGGPSGSTFWFYEVISGPVTNVNTNPLQGPMSPGGSIASGGMTAYITGSPTSAVTVSSSTFGGNQTVQCYVVVGWVLSGQSPVYMNPTFWATYTVGGTGGKSGKFDSTGVPLSAAGGPVDGTGTPTTPQEYIKNDTITNTTNQPMTVRVTRTDTGTGTQIDQRIITIAPNSAYVQSSANRSPFSTSYEQGTSDGGDPPLYSWSPMAGGGAASASGSGADLSAMGGVGGTTSSTYPTTATAPTPPTDATPTAEGSNNNAILDSNEAQRNKDLEKHVDQVTSAVTNAQNMAHADSVAAAGSAAAAAAHSAVMEGLLGQIAGNTASHGGSTTTTNGSLESTQSAIKADDDAIKIDADALENAETGTATPGVGAPSGWSGVPTNIASIYGDVQAMGLGFSAGSAGGAGHSLAWDYNVMGWSGTLDVGSKLGSWVGVVRGVQLAILAMFSVFAGIKIIRGAFA